MIFLLYFLPAALLLYWTCEFSRPAQNICLLIFSLVFYAWGEPLYLVPMLFLVVVNHMAGRGVANQSLPRNKWRIIKIATALNIGMLLFVLYGENLVPVVSERLGAAIPWPPRAPLGIAFFTLQALSYVYDIGRGKARPESNIVNTGLYIAFLPTVLAGPILRFGDMASQLHERRMTFPLFGMGCERFIVGLAKVILLGVPLSRMADAVFNLSAAGNEFVDTPVALAWTGLFAFGLQLYLVFSGYSDMAVGLGRMFGFTVKENFRHPYVARTVADFWKRCHITLYRWFFVYVFLSMGGSRPKKVVVRGGATRLRNHVLRNFVVLWLLIGVWHGVSWNHLFFGVWYFVFTFLEWVVSLQRKDVRHFAWHIYVLFVVLVGWVFLRCNNTGETLNFLSNLLGVNDNGFHSDLARAFLMENWHVFLLSALFCTPAGEMALGWLRRDRKGVAGWCVGVLYLAVLVGLLGLSFIFLTRTGHVIPFVFGRL